MVALPCRWAIWALALVVAAVALLADNSADAGSQSRSDVRITVELRGLSLGEALETVADMSGQQLEVSGDLGERRVSVTLRDATLQESLEKILYPQDFIVDWSAQGRTTVHLLGGTGVANTSFSGSRPLDPSQIELFSPGGDNLVGLTAGENETLRASWPPQDLSQIELFPPGGDNLVGLTVGENEALRASWPAQDLSQIELFPPDGDEVFGLTVEENEALRESWPSQDLSQIELFPPD